MSKLLKSKFLLGAMTFAVMFVGVVAVATSASADCVVTATVRVGSTGASVQCIQTKLGLSADGSFGPMTKAAVMAFQASHGLTADGVVGPMTAASMNGVMAGGSYPAGCTSNSGYSTTTGMSCAGSSYPAGCTSTSGFSTTTGMSCSGGSSNLPAGCTSTSGFSSTTGASCAGGSSSSSGPLTGGAGTLDFTTTTSNTESTVKEGATEKVLAFKAEADGSDIEVTNVKVVLQNDDYATTSERLTDYIDEVSIWMGDKKVGSADASDFSKDTGSPDTFTKTIALSNAIIRDGVKSTLYVGVSANSNIDSTDMATADWNVMADTVRFTDATGIVLSESLGDDANFGFEDGSADDDISIKSSSSNPVASTLQVEENQNSDSFLVGAFKLDVDDQSDDVTLTSLSVTLTIDDASDTAASDDAADIVDEVVIKIDGKDYTADLDSESVTNGDGDGVYMVDLSGDEVTIDSGNAVEVKVYATFNDQDTNYGVGTTVFASLTGSTDIDAETSNDDVSVTGSYTGKTHTLSVNAPTFALVSKSLAISQAIDGVAAGEEDVFLAKFVFNVTAGDDDVYLSKGQLGDEADYNTTADELNYTQLGGGSIDSVVLDADDETLDDGLTSSFLISSGSTEKFTLSFYIRGNDEADKITIDSFAYGAADDASTQYDYNSTVDSGLSAFATSTVYLAK